MSGSRVHASSTDAFEIHLERLCSDLDCKPHELNVNREIVIAALRKAPALSQCLGYSELTSAPTTMVSWPWREKAGVIDESDDLRMGDWLSNNYGLKGASRASLYEAMTTVADERRFHPIRDWLHGLHWDGKQRLDRWLMHVAQIDAESIPERQRRYFEMISRFVLVGHVARVMKPGCKFDYPHRSLAR